MTEGEAQAALAGIALELVGIEDRLRRIAESLPVPADLDAMLEGRAPRDVATEVAAKVLCVADDEIGSAVETLEGLARVTADDLAEVWRAGR